MDKVFILLIVALICLMTALVDSERKVEIHPSIGFSMDTLSEERWSSDKAFFVERAKQLGATSIIAIADSDDMAQISQIRELINQDIDVLVVIPHDSEKLASILKTARSRGVKVISYARPINSNNVDYHIGFNPIQVGELQAEGILNVIRRGKIAYLGGPLTDSNSILLKQGTMNVLNNRISIGEIEIVLDESIDDWNPDIAYENLSAYLENNEVDGVIAANDDLAMGAIRALEKANLSEVPVSGGDADLSACQRIVAGKQTSTVYMPIKELAYKVAELSVQVANNDEDKTNKTISIDSVLVDKENMDEAVIETGFHSYDEIYKM
jgi:D-xylose transport system substrate-binding protein